MTRTREGTLQVKGPRTPGPILEATDLTLSVAGNEAYALPHKGMPPDRQLPGGPWTFHFQLP